MSSNKLKNTSKNMTNKQRNIKLDMHLGKKLTYEEYCQLTNKQQTSLLKHSLNNAINNITDKNCKTCKKRCKQELQNLPSNFKPINHKKHAQILVDLVCQIHHADLFYHHSPPNEGTMDLLEIITPEWHDDGTKTPKLLAQAWGNNYKEACNIASLKTLGIVEADDGQTSNTTRFFKDYNL